MNVHLSDICEELGVSKRIFSTYIREYQPVCAFFRSKVDVPMPHTTNSGVRRYGMGGVH